MTRSAGSATGGRATTAIRTMRRAITVAFFLSAGFYLLFAHSPSLVVALICVLGAHSGGSIQWVFSTTLLQIAVPDRFLGRVFALEMALLTLTMSVSTYVTGWGVDYPGLGARSMATALGIITVGCAVILAIPGLAVLGAILTTGFLGGAIATHFRLTEIFSPPQLICLLLGVVMWGGLYLGDARVRALIPVGTRAEAVP